MVGRRRAYQLASLGIGLAALCLPRPVVAGETESKTLFAEGRQLRASDQCAQAIEKFRLALEAYPEGLGALRNVAECEEALGRYASARRSWWDLRLAVLRSPSPKYDGWDEDAAQAHARLATKVARLIVRTSPAGLPVVVDGRPLDPRLLGSELEMDLGTVELSIQGDPGLSPRRTLTLTEGERREVELALPDSASRGAGDAGSKTPAAPQRPDLSNEGPSPLAISGGLALGLGGLSLVGLGVAAAVRGAALSDVDAACGSDLDRCVVSATERSELDAAIDRGVTASDLVTGFAVAAGVLVGAGVGLLIGEAASSTVTVAAGPGHAELTWAVAW
jgi:hypothetical protein